MTLGRAVSYGDLIDKLKALEPYESYGSFIGELWGILDELKVLSIFEMK